MIWYALVGFLTLTAAVMAGYFLGVHMTLASQADDQRREMMRAQAESDFNRSLENNPIYQKNLKRLEDQGKAALNAIRGPAT